MDPVHRADAVNVAHYLALRHGDVRHLQRWLGERGLSSLGRCEPHVLATVESVRAALEGRVAISGPAHVHKASADANRPCRVSMDLPGPKLRTGPLADGPQVVKLRPERDLRGVAIKPAVASLVAGSAPDTHGTALPVDPSWIGRRKPGDEITMVDSRGSRRRLHIIEAAPGKVRSRVLGHHLYGDGRRLGLRGRRDPGGWAGQNPAIPLALRRRRPHADPDLAPAVPWRHGQPGSARSDAPCRPLSTQPRPANASSSTTGRSPASSKPSAPTGCTCAS